MDRTKDKCRGSLFGGAAGDALGYAVEFDNYTEIVRKYGNGGISDYATDEKGIARFSDDTQMTLFTAEGLLTAVQNERGKINPEEIEREIRSAYEAWYATQVDYQLPLPSSWLSNLRGLWERRAPGNTCLSALHDLRNRKEVANDSKGCGGVMRIAPIGIFFGAEIKSGKRVEDYPQIVAKTAGQAALLTHHHSMSTVASAMTALIISRCITEEYINKEALTEIILQSMAEAIEYWKPKEKDYFSALILRAIALADGDVGDHDAIRRLGEGWVAEETLSIAIFSTLRHIDDFEKCLECAVNHDGDSDSTGAVAGNLIGAILGYEAIPEKYRKNLEMGDVIISVADDLAGVAGKKRMEKRYAKHEPADIDPELTIYGTMEYTPERIEELGPDDIFVFGSNLAGHHAGGAARIAEKKFGAIWGQGVGLQGQSYAIPTMQGGVATIKPYVDEFIEVARECDQNTFYVTRIGCGIAGFKDEEIAPLFKEALKLYNVRLPKSFVDIIRKTR